MKYWLLPLVLSIACRDTYVLPVADVNNAMPLALAGTGTTVKVGTVVDLDGSHWFDPDGTLVFHRWELMQTPAGSSAVLSSTMTSTTSFVADRVGNYYLALTVRDEDGAMARDELAIVAATTLLPPTAVTADAGGDTTIGWLTRGQVTGSVSATNGFTPTYSWSMIARPFYSTATLANATTLTPAFIADAQGVYTLQLTATADGVTMTDTVDVTAFTEGVSIGAPMFEEPVVVRYSIALDRLILLRNNPVSVSVVDPATGLGPTIDLPVTLQQPHSLVLHPSGLRAAVGVPGEITIVSLQPLSVEQVFGAPSNNSNLIFAPDNRVHSIPSPDDASENIITLNLANGAIAEVVTNAMFRGGTMHPGGQAMYLVDGAASVIARYDIASSPISLQRQAPFANPSGIYFLSDASSMVTGAGAVLRSSSSAANDMTVLGSLQATNIESLSHSSVTHEIATVSEGGPLYKISWFNDTTFARRFTAPLVTWGNNTYWRGFVAYRADGRMYFVGGYSSESTVYTVSPPPL